MEFFKKYYLDVFQNHYFDFDGKAKTDQFWYFVLCNIIIFSLLYMITSFLGFFGSFIYWAASLFALIPSIAIAIRRLHDVKLSGWFMLLWFTVIGGIVLIIFWAMPSKK